MKDNQGAIFINEGKFGNSPQLSGYVMLNGREVKFSCWEKVSPKGTKYYHLKVREDLPEKKVETPKKIESSQEPFVDDDVPF